MENQRQREFEFELPIGYVDDDGKLHRAAVLRKMTGRDEAIMADKKNRHNGARMITQLLSNCLVRLGDIERPGASLTRALYSADRHFLLVKLREITFGREYPEEWGRIGNEPAGQFLTERGLFTFATVYPLLQGWHSSNGSGEAFEESTARFGAEEYYWKVLSRATPDVVHAT